MTRLVGLFLLLSLSLSLFSQYATPVVLCNEETSPITAVCVASVDIDGDGDLDVLSASFGDNKIGWSENLGSGVFALQKKISDQTLGAKFVCSDDMDGDGDFDVMSASSIDNSIRYFENLGNGLFGAGVIISSSAFGANIVRAADLDNDGDKDIISGSFTDDKIAWYENLGGGVFGSQQVITTSADQITLLVIDDIDNDGDQDIISTYLNAIVYYRNDGTGNFPTIENSGNSSIGWKDLRVVDIDGDGDKDIVAVSQVGASNQVKILPNNGSNTFSSSQILYSVSSGNISSLAIGDVDNDLDLDIIFGFSQPYQIGKIENLGSGIYGAAQFILSYPAYRLELNDINSDGRIDIISSSAYADKIAWYQNLPTGVFSNQNVISSSVQTSSINVVDLNADGKKDILYSSYSFSEVGWFKNLGNGKYGNAKTVSCLVDHVRSAYYADFDNDGLIDIVTASFDDNTIAWFKNESLGNFGPKQIISTNVMGAYDVFCADLDGDGDMDVISASQTDNKIAWYENLGSGLFGVQVVITTAANGAWSCYASDLDNDGDMDILSASYANDKIAWYENLGGGIFGSQNVITALTDGPCDVTTADLDGDGDQDVISATYNDDEVAWYENLGGGLFGVQQVLASALSGVVSVNPIDFDNDGDIDILYPDGTGDLFMIENSGNGIFGVPYVIINSEPWSFTATGDIDSDGDMDIVFGSQIDWSVNVSKNLLFEPYQVRGRLFYDDDQNGLMDGNDLGLDQLSVLTNPLNAFTFTYSDGKYIINFDSTNFGLYEVFPNINSDWHITSDSLLFHVMVDSTFTVADSLDFGLHPNSLNYNFSSELSGGFPSCNTVINYWLTAKNIGTLIAPGVLHLKLDDDVNFISSSILPDSTFGQNFYWSFDTLNYFSSSTINIQVQLPNFTFMGDTLSSILTSIAIDSLGNQIIFPSDTLNQILVCAYDPNDKTVTPQGVDSLGYIPLETNLLEYLIRFQNTGTDTAINVIIKDKLDDDLDWSTLNILSYSHNIQIDVSPTGVISFLFESIMLPDSNTNELASHGFVKYNISPKPNLTSPTTILNTAEIYFDFNPPVITNTTINTLFNCQNNIDDIAFSNSACIGENLLYFVGDSSTNTNYIWNLVGIDSVETNSFAWTADSVGTFDLEFYMSNNFCQADTTIQLEVHPEPLLDFNSIGNDTLCSVTSAITLVATPSGGIFSGLGVLGDSFDPSIPAIGQHNLFYNYTDINGCSSIDSINIYIQNCLSIDEIELIEVLIYPNPLHSGQQLFVELPESLTGVVYCQIIDLGGNVVLKQNVSSTSFVIKIPSLQSGIYFITFQTGFGVLNKKLVVLE